MRLANFLLLISVCLAGCHNLGTNCRSEKAPEVTSGVTANDLVQAEEAFTHVGTFSNMEFTEEHQYGSEVQLWKADGKIVGQFSNSEGLAGDTPAGLLQKVFYNEQTGAIRFEAKLTMGQHFCKEHKGTPTRDLFKFEGSLTESSLKGVLRQLDALHGYRPSVEQKQVELKRVKTEVPTQTYNQWVEQTGIVLRFRGPKW